MAARTTREAMWARQQIRYSDPDYGLWKGKKKLLQEMAGTLPGCLFAVDVYRQRYAFASSHFADLFGYSPNDLDTIEDQGDLLEEKIHPDDRACMIDLQIRHSEFIYSLQPEHRNEYQTLYQFRMLNVKKNYINVTSRQQVFLTDRQEKAWIILGIMDIAPDQTPPQTVRHTVLHRKTGETISYPITAPSNNILTQREKEILDKIQKGWLSKEIADRLNISLYTVHNHRKNILAKLQAGNAMEAVRTAIRNGILK